MVLIAQTAFTTGLNSAASRRPQRGPFLTARCCYACRDDASDQFVVLRVIFAGDEGRRAEYYPAENPGARRNQFLLRAHYSPFLTRFHVWAFVIRVSEERGPNCPRRFAETARTRRASLPLRLNTQAGLQSQESGDENVGRTSRQRLSPRKRQPSGDRPPALDHRKARRTSSEHAGLRRLARRVRAVSGNLQGQFGPRSSGT
jgi:hypothetical protein